MPWQSLLHRHLAEVAQPLVVVLGPTASGKTSFSLQLAKEIVSKRGGEWGSAEIINADSRQLYRHLDIGTAKIRSEEHPDVPHHLFSVLDPKEEVTVAWYKEKATEVIREVLGRKRVPVLVGGSMLYISSIVDGLEPLPQSDASVRARLEAEYDKDDGWTLYERLEEVDPKTAASFEQQNRQYVVRALELYELTGKPASELKGTVPCPFDVLIFGLSWPREQITERIDRRTSELLAAGWIEEVEGLLDRGYTAMDPGMKSHGYREVMAWLRSEEPNREELERVIAAKTRQYAKRQMTWWKDDDRIHWVQPYEWM